MAARPITAALRPALFALFAGLLAGCATGHEATQEQWTGRHFYPQEYCQGVYARKYLDRPDYWSLRRWCDKREMQSDMFM